MNLSLKLLNALPDEQAQVEAAEQLLNRLQRLDLDAYQVEYLNAWQRFYTNHRYYLFPDDRATSEFASPRLEDVSAQSYERTAHTVKQTRQAVLQSNKERLDNVLFTATSPTTRQHKLAHECYNTAERLDQYDDNIFADLTAATYTPCLPAPGFQPERRVDDPATVGAALGLLDFLAYVCAEYKTGPLSSPTTSPPAATPATPNPAAEAFAPLLMNYTLDELTALIRESGLLDPTTGRPTPAASPGAWVGVIHALLNPKRPYLRRNMAAIRRALVAAFGAQVSESALQAGISKRGSESEQFRDRTLALLAAPATGD